MKLSDLFKNAPDIEIEQLSSDSRMPMKNAIFFCLDGIKYDGHKFINEAISNGAKVIVYSDELESKSNAIYIKVKNVNETLKRIADIFYNHPNVGIEKYLISGCYGRSSVSEIINHCLNKLSSCGSVGTFGINYKDKHLDLTYPTLTPLENLKVLDNFKKNGVKNITFESNVINLYYRKFDVINPDIFIYTNTSRSCSDYRACNNYYFENLRKYLYTLEDNTIVLFNGDDESYNELNECVNNYYSYGKNANCDYIISDIKLFNDGLSYILKHEDVEYEIKSQLLGEVNVYNLTSAIAALNLKGYDIQTVVNSLSDIKYIDGVMQKVNSDFNVIVDCGYELDSVENISSYAKTLCKKRLIGILGINYSDTEQRIKSLMQVLEKYFDEIILTEDESLQGEVMKILSKADKFTSSNKVLHIPYRSIAIENAINIMNGDDTLLIMGKGNEKYLSMGLGKEKYLGDLHYANKYLNLRKENKYETIEIY